MSLRMPKYHCFTEEGAFLSAGMRVETDMPIAERYIREAAPRRYAEVVSFGGVYLIEEVPESIRKRVQEGFGVAFSANADAFAVVLDGDVRVYAGSKRGLLYGALEVLQLAEAQYLRKGMFYCAPVCEVRGAKVYLPGKENIPFFKSFIDFLVSLRMNVLMLEIGGAMEYKRHPEINEGWLEYCVDIGEYSAKAAKIQEQTYTWQKNSIHVENGEGKFLTQDEVRELVAYCNERHIEIIPEVPSHSHCDYLLLRHPEIRERQNDPYADTYCPSDERSYALLFDVLDEVIDVFKPKAINMGHDEFYTVAKCEKCKGKSPVELYANDVIRIHDYLASKNVQMIIWGEKLLNARSAEGKPCGGAAYTGDWCLYPTEPIPEIYPCADLLPKDLCILHWYWGMPNEYDEEYHKRGFPMIFGNFSPTHMKNWRRRMESGARGGITSNWSTLKQENLQRNGVLFDLAYGSLLYWEDDYNADMAADFERQAFALLYALGNGGIRKGIRVVHSADWDLTYSGFADGVFIEREKYDLGGYRVTFTNGADAYLPVVYGQNIRGLLANEKRALHEVAYTTLPIRVQTNRGVEWRYETVFALPEECGGLVSFVYEPNPANAAAVTVYKAEMFDERPVSDFGVAAVVSTDGRRLLNWH